MPCAPCWSGPRLRACGGRITCLADLRVSRVADLVANHLEFGGGLRGGRRSWSVIAAFVQLDLLEPRPTELDNVAARFVVAKAPATLSVAAKPLMFADNLARFEHCASRQQAQRTLSS